MNNQFALTCTDMKILLSIKPEYAEKIFQGIKKFEYRKSIFKKFNISTVVVYATLPVGKVIGEFDIGWVLSDNPDTLWNLTSEAAGISRQLYNEYFRGRNKAYAIRVKNPYLYREPIDLKSITLNGTAPQSFCYLVSS